MRSAGAGPQGEYLVALDMVGADRGQLVLLTQGSSCRWTARTDDRPMDTLVVAIVDTIDQRGRRDLEPGRAEAEQWQTSAEEIRHIVEQVLKSADLQALLGRSVRGRRAAASAGHGRFRRHRLRGRGGGGRAAGARARFRWTRGARMIDAMRQAVLDANESLAAEAVAETGLGNVRDKKMKNALAATKTPGVEDVEPSAYLRRARPDDHRAGPLRRDRGHHARDEPPCHHHVATPSA